MRFDRNESLKYPKNHPFKKGYKSPLRIGSSLHDRPDGSTHQMISSRRMNNAMNAFCSARIQLDGIYFEFNEDLMIDKKQ